MNTILIRTFAVAMLLVLAACGGGGGGGGSAAVPPPPSGSLDTSFGSGGKVTTNLGSDFDDAFALALQADGKIVVAGNSDGGSSGLDFALVRYNTDGTLDSTGFGVNGIVKTDLNGANDSEQGFAVTVADNKIVMAGFSSASGDANFALARYLSDGSLDTGFSGNGVVKTNLNGTADIASALAVQSSGKILAAGWTNSNGDLDFAIVRYNTDGSRDTTFGANGVVRTDFAGADDLALSIVVMPNDQLVVAGKSGGHFALARYLPDGDLDLTFGPNLDGKVRTIVQFGSEIRALAIQTNGSIVVAGFADVGASNGHDFVVARYLSNGTLDSAGFGFFGATFTDFATGDDEAFGVAIQSDGKIIATGYASDSTGKSLALVRYATDGSLDPGFASSGKLVIDMGSSIEGARAIVIQPDGRIVVAGYTVTTGGNDFALVRVNP